MKDQDIHPYLTAKKNMIDLALDTIRLVKKIGFEIVKRH